MLEILFLLHQTDVFFYFSMQYFGNNNKKMHTLEIGLEHVTELYFRNAVWTN